MKILPLTASLLMAGLALAPLAQAAPGGKGNQQASASTKRKPKPAPKPTPKPTPKPEKTAADKPSQEQEQAAAIVADTPAPTPAQPAATPDTASYEQFIKALNEQIAGNTYDSCPPLSTALKALDNNEFAVFDWMKKAAEEGNAAAQHYMASLVLSSPLGNPNSPEYKHALDLMKKSADQGFIPAKLDYVLFLRSGRGIPKDENAAQAILMEACKTGDMQARCKWLLLTDRMKSAEDIKRPEVKHEIDRGNHYVLFYMIEYFNGEERVKMMEQAAKLGNSDAVYLIAQQLAKPNPQKSFELLQIAVEQHNERALFALGAMMLEPDQSQLATLIQKDYPMGMRLLKTSFLMGNGAAGAMLAGIYYDGLCEQPKNRELAFRHYQFALQDHGDMTAAAAMGIMMLKGDGATQDSKKGMEMLQAAYKAHAENAPILLAYAHYEGLGCEKDASKALDYLQEAAYTPYSYLFQAYIYAKGGVNVEPDSLTADSYVRMAELDMGAKARELFDKMMAEGKWDPHP